MNSGAGRGGAGGPWPARWSAAACAVLALASVAAHAQAAADDKTAAPGPATGTQDAASTTAPPDTAASVTAALQGQEGVRIQTMCTHCNSANVQLGGLAEELVPIELDGYPLLGGLSTSFVLSMLPADTVAETKVEKGPGSAHSPSTAAGGTIRLIGARPRELPHWDAGVVTGSYARRGATLRAAGPLGGGFSGAVVVGKERADAINDDGDQWKDIAGTDRFLADGRLYFRPSAAHEFNLGASYIDEENLDGRGAYDYLYVTYPTTQNPPKWVREDALFLRREFRAGWTWRATDAGTFEFKLLEASRNQRVRSPGTQNPLYTNDLRAFRDRIVVDEAQRWGHAAWHQVSVKGGFTVGVEGQYEGVSALQAGVVTQIVTDYVKTWSQFAEGTRQIGDRWSIEGGVRRDRDENFGARTSPRATVRWRPTTSWMLRALAGGTFRPPQPIFSKVCCGQQYQRNTNARAEHGLTYGVEAQYQPSDRLRASVYVSRTDFTDYLVRAVAYSQLAIQTYAMINVPDARAETLELAGRWSPVRSVTFDASIGWTTLLNEGAEGVQARIIPPLRPPTLVTIPFKRIPYHPERTGSVSANVGLPRGVALSLQASYTGAMLIQQWNPDIYAAANLLRDELRPTPGFWVLNLGVLAPLPKGLSLSAGIDNATNYIQTDLGDFTRDYNWGPLAGRSWRVGLRWAPR